MVLAKANTLTGLAWPGAAATPEFVRAVAPQILSLRVSVGFLGGNEGAAVIPGSRHVRKGRLRGLIGQLPPEHLLALDDCLEACLHRVWQIRAKSQSACYRRGGPASRINAATAPGWVRSGMCPHAMRVVLLFIRVAIQDWVSMLAIRSFSHARNQVGLVFHAGGPIGSVRHVRWIGF